MVILCFFSGCFFYNLSSNILEIIGLILQAISLGLLIYLLLFNLEISPLVNFIFFILMLIITIINIILSIFVKYWSSKGLIKTSKRNKGIYISTTCYLLSILNFIFSINGILKKYESDSDIISVVIYEFVLILEIWIWYILRKRIIQGLDGPDSPIAWQKTMYDQYGRKVVIVQSNDDTNLDWQPHIDIDLSKQNQDNNIKKDNPGHSQNILDNQIYFNQQMPQSQENVIN